MYRYNFVLWNCQWIAKENLSHGTQSKERKLLSTDLVNNRFLNYEQGGVVGDLWRHSKWRTSYILRNLFKDANKESKHFSSALKDENFMIKYIFWYKIFLIKKNKQTKRQTDKTRDVGCINHTAWCIPLHVRPSEWSSYPLLQRHTNDPSVFWHIWLHPDEPLEHSSMSVV